MSHSENTLSLNPRNIKSLTGHKTSLTVVDERGYVSFQIHARVDKTQTTRSNAGHTMVLFLEQNIKIIERNDCVEVTVLGNKTVYRESGVEFHPSSSEKSL